MYFQYIHIFIGLLQGYGKSIANAQKLPQSCTNSKRLI